MQKKDDVERRISQLRESLQGQLVKLYEEFRALRATCKTEQDIEAAREHAWSLLVERPAKNRAAKKIMVELLLLFFEQYKKSVTGGEVATFPLSLIGEVPECAPGFMKFIVRDNKISCAKSSIFLEVLEAALKELGRYKIDSHEFRRQVWKVEDHKCTGGCPYNHQKDEDYERNEESADQLRALLEKSGDPSLSGGTPRDGKAIAGTISLVLYRL